MAGNNPFKPSFGVSPPVLAGRGDLLDSFEDAFDAGPGHPDYTALLVGVRGAGKTVALNAIQQQAHSRDWCVIVENAYADLCLRVVNTIRQLMSMNRVPSAHPRLSGIRAFGVGVDFKHPDQRSAAAGLPGLRSVLTEFASVLASEDRGLLITIDELQGAEPAELREFATVLQHVTRREQMPVAFVAAGLPNIDDTLLQDSAVTFLQRCSRYEIGGLNEAATVRAFSEPIQAYGGHITDEALERVVKASSGYPFMVQLIGFHAWKAATGNPPKLTITEALSGVTEAERRLPHLVILPMWRAMSTMDRRFVLAMAIDDEESATIDIAARLNRNSSYISIYRSRLIRAGFIHSTRHGFVDFTHKITRTWLRSDRVPGIPLDHNQNR